MKRSNFQQREYACFRKIVQFSTKMICILENVYDRHNKYTGECVFLETQVIKNCDKCLTLNTDDNMNNNVLITLNYKCPLPKR